MNNKTFSAIAAIVMLFALSSCNPGKMAFNKGDKQYNYGEYDLAITSYGKAVEESYMPADANYKIAESYRLSNRLREAEAYYKAALDAGSGEENARFFYGYALKANGKYQEAENQFRNYLRAAGNPNYTKRATKEVSNLQALTDILTKDDFEVEGAENINTDAIEYFTTIQGNDLYFVSSRGAEKVYRATGTPYTDIFKVKVKETSVDNTTIEKMASMFNTADANEGAVTFTPDGKTMVFARGNVNKRKSPDEVDLYISRLKDGAWSEPEIINISGEDSWDSTPMFSADGKTLYFASNRKNGLGGTDIYAASYNGRTRFGRPQNLGDKINTSGNELFPHVKKDGTLYFSSDGHPSLGELDIFSAKTDENGVMTVENLGTAINSSNDDFGIFYTSDTEGFFSSNREGGKGNDDIYTFIEGEKIKIAHYFLEGVTVTTNDDGEEEILPFTKIRLVDNKDSVLAETVTGEDGTFRFPIETEKTYTLIGEKQDYFTKRHPYSTIGRTVPQEELENPENDIIFDTKVHLEKIVIDKAIVLENIYYDFDKYDIRPDAAIELDKLVGILNDNPDITIELSSHTDSRGSNSYNQRLSQQRAESAVAYIISKGIAESRITARGYGESQPIVPNATEEEEHQLNRRTEFKVTEINSSGEGQ